MHPYELITVTVDPHAPLSLPKVVISVGFSKWSGSSLDAFDPHVVPWFQVEEHSSRPVEQSETVERSNNVSTG